MPPCPSPLGPHRGISICTFVWVSVFLNLEVVFPYEPKAHTDIVVLLHALPWSVGPDHSGFSDGGLESALCGSSHRTHRRGHETHRRERRRHPRVSPRRRRQLLHSSAA